MEAEIRVNARLEEAWRKKKPGTANKKGERHTERVPCNEVTMW